MSSSSSIAKPPRPRFYRRKAFRWTVGVAGGVVLATALAFALSPWPGALLIRRVFEDDAANVKEAMEAFAPEGVAAITNEQYRADDDDAYLDVYFPESSVEQAVVHPTVVWTHGGAWISGSKDDTVPYFQLIAKEGYTVVALNYSLGPESTYPTAVHQINDALAWIQDNAARLHIDPANIILAGDSAGSQLSSQIAALTTNPDYAAEMGITPSLTADQLKGVVLFCGIYDPVGIWDAGKGLLRWGFQVSLWAYTGDRSKDGNRSLEQMSTINYVTDAFPPAFISGGNADPLTKSQSVPFAARLDSLGVETSTLFFAEDHEPELAHEYQFRLGNADGQEALARMLAFIDAHMD
jgi:acetyl esterase/lipase